MIIRLREACCDFGPLTELLVVDTDVSGKPAVSSSLARNSNLLSSGYASACCLEKIVCGTETPWMALSTWTPGILWWRTALNFSRCTQDYEVKNWKECTEYAAFGEGVQQSPVGGKSSICKQQEATGKMGPRDDRDLGGDDKIEDLYRGELAFTRQAISLPLRRKPILFNALQAR
ncbi:hypothetical protein BU16DRAFT_342163 [Lophium mytilinum]|uniref:Uncharacterized protein n=1 Tax=Lophium mytilinum TaxID=390894 RepID=A0A6A6QX74_9PEZI|nr:hypothetical protein BU16DRAFT_342163 [Lophium mytilinum]